MIRTLWVLSIVFLGILLLVEARVSAFELTGQSWQVAKPMGEDWVVCSAGMPVSASQSTKDGAAVWNYSEFNFTFAGDDCLSGGEYPSINGVDQVDFGDLPDGVLGQNITIFTPSTGAISECDMRFSDSFVWHTGTGSPGNDEFDWQSTATHEMGHCLGLDHPITIDPNDKPVMASGQAAGEVLRDLTADDIEGRNFIYGPPQQMDGDGFDPADANQDGMVTSADITCTILGIFGMPCPMPDCNEDGSATSADITCVILEIFNQ